MTESFFANNLLIVGIFIVIDVVLRIFLVIEVVGGADLISALI